MNDNILWVLVMLITAFRAVVARDIPYGPGRNLNDFMISKAENVMDNSNYTAHRKTNRMGCPDLVRCDGNVQYHPHPIDPSVFFQCSGSTPIKQSCNTGTVWSQALLTCVHLPGVNCDPNVAAPVSPSFLDTCSCGIVNPSKRIVDGFSLWEQALPWQVGLRRARLPLYVDSITCGGSIINTKYVLTAAHCVTNNDYYANLYGNLHVHIGEHDQNDNIKDNKNNNKLIIVEDIKIHPCYNSITIDNDFALLKLAESIIFNAVIRPVCLPVDDSQTYVGKEALVSGWGVTVYAKETTSPPTLRAVFLKIFDNNHCGKWDKNIITSNMLCAGDPINWSKASCSGDSGGPLSVFESRGGILRNVQVGVVSFGTGQVDPCTLDPIAGTGCNVKDYPPVYSRVSKVLDWIMAESASGQFCDK